MSTTKSKKVNRSSKAIEKEISELGEMKAKTFAELEEKRASFLPKAELNKLIIAEATGDAEASVQLVEYRTESDDAQRMLNLIDAIDHQLPELQKELNRATLVANMKHEKELGEKSDPITREITNHLAEAAKLIPKWMEIETERYGLRMTWNAKGRIPREVAYGWLRREFGRILYPYLELPPQPRVDRKGE